MGEDLSEVYCGVRPGTRLLRSEKLVQRTVLAHGPPPIFFSGQNPKMYLVSWLVLDIKKST